MQQIDSTWQNAANWLELWWRHIPGAKMSPMQQIDASRIQPTDLNGGRYPLISAERPLMQKIAATRNVANTAN